MNASPSKGGPHYILWADGSAKASSIGWGVVFWRKAAVTVQTLCGGTQLAEGLEYAAEAAEWHAAVQALELVRGRKRPVLLLTDSQQVVDFLEGLLQGACPNMDAFAQRVGYDVFFRLGHAARELPCLQVMKVKGHAGSQGNRIADNLATKGRETLCTQEGSVTDRTLGQEVLTLARTGTTAYSKARQPRQAPAVKKPPKPRKLASPPATPLGSKAVKALTKGQYFGPTEDEARQLKAQAAEMLRKAEALPSRNPAQRKRRKAAMDRARGYVSATSRALMKRRRKLAAQELHASASRAPARRGRAPAAY